MTREEEEPLKEMGTGGITSGLVTGVKCAKGDQDYSVPPPPKKKYRKARRGGREKPKIRHRWLAPPTHTHTQRERMAKKKPFTQMMECERKAMRKEESGRLPIFCSTLLSHLRRRRLRFFLPASNPVCSPLLLPPPPLLLSPLSLMRSEKSWSSIFHARLFSISKKKKPPQRMSIKFHIPHVGFP